MKDFELTSVDIENYNVPIQSRTETILTLLFPSSSTISFLAKALTTAGGAR